MSWKISSVSSDKKIRNLNNSYPLIMMKSPHSKNPATTLSLESPN